MQPLRLNGGRIVSATVFMVHGANQLHYVCLYNFVNKQDTAQTT